MADVAQLANVSTMTVSRVLNGRPGVSAVLRERVQSAIQTLAYVPNQHAQALARARAPLIAALLPSLSNQIYAEVIRGMHEAAQGSGLAIQMATTHYDPAEEERLLAIVLAQRPGGLVLTGNEQTPRARQMIHQAACPVVQIMDDIARPIDRVVGFSHTQAARLAADHLHACGARAAAFLGRGRDARSQKRASAFSAQWRARTGQAASILDAERSTSVAEGCRLLRQLMHQGHKAAGQALAIFCNNDVLALGVLFEAQRLSCQVPEDLLILGFNDLEFCASAEPALSSIRTPRYEVGRQAIARLLELDTKHPKRQLLACELVQRQSTQIRTGPR